MWRKISYQCSMINIFRLKYGIGDVYTFTVLLEHKLTIVRSGTDFGLGG